MRAVESALRSVETVAKEAVGQWNSYRPGDRRTACGADGRSALRAEFREHPTAGICPTSVQEAVLPGRPRPTQRRAHRPLRWRYPGAVQHWPNVPVAAIQQRIVQWSFEERAVRERPANHPFMPRCCRKGIVRLQETTLERFNSDGATKAINRHGEEVRSPAASAGRRTAHSGPILRGAKALRGEAVVGLAALHRCARRGVYGGGAEGVREGGRWCSAEASLSATSN